MRCILSSPLTQAIHTIAERTAQRTAQRTALPARAHGRRGLSSLGSPMFPHMPSHEVAVKAVPKGEEDFMTRHGGKIAAGALAVTAAIIYTYYESGQSKTKVEEGLNDRMTIEPYEVNELRFINNLTPRVYEALSLACLNHFSASEGISADYPEATYPDFVSFVTAFLEKYNDEHKAEGAATFSLRGGHLFDRLISFYILSGRHRINRGGDNNRGGENNTNSIESSTEVPSLLSVGVEGGSKGEGKAAAATKISVTYMLVALNMAVRTAADERTDALFTLAQFLSAYDDTKEEGDSSDRITAEQEGQVGVKDSTPLKSIGSEKKEGEKEEGKGVEGEREEVFVSGRAAEEIVRDLYNSWQVPNEKRVAETGVRYPIKTYREKTGREMVDQFKEAQKPPITGDKLSKSEFRELILGSHVCAWAECYRGR